MRNAVVRVALALAMVSVVGAPADALTTWNFAGGGGVLGSTQAFIATDTVTSLTAAGSLVSTGAALPLHQDVKGLGIVGGCTNDISACGGAEVLRLQFPTAGWDPVSLTLQNLGDASNTGDPWLVFGDNDGDFLNGATLLAAGDATGSAARQLTVLLSGATPIRFLYLSPASNAPGSDFRLLRVVGEAPAAVRVAEPEMWALLGACSFTLVLLARRLRRPLTT